VLYVQFRNMGVLPWQESCGVFVRFLRRWAFIEYRWISGNDINPKQSKTSNLPYDFFEDFTIYLTPDNKIYLRGQSIQIQNESLK
jgi:hypothetical protein